MYEGVRVSQHVTSQVRDWPLFQGITVTPSAGLPFAWQRPTGSNIDEMFAALLHGMDVDPDSSYNSAHVFLSCPYGHRLGCTDEGQKVITRARRPTATLTASSSIQSPREDAGIAVSQAPDSFLWAASNLALDLGSWAEYSIMANKEASTKRVLHLTGSG